MKMIIVLLILVSMVEAVYSRSSIDRARRGDAEDAAEVTALIEADPDYARTFLKSFNSFCPTTGTWTTNALSASREIEKVLVNLRDDPDCQDIAKSIAVHTGNLSYALNRIEQTSIERDILSVQRQQSDILLLLGSETDPTRIAELENLFRSNQLSLSTSEGALQYDQDKARDYYLTNVMVNSAAQLFQQASLNQMCLIKSPTLLSSLSSIGSSFAAALVTGGASLGFAAASSILGYVFDFIRKAKINRQIQQLGQVEFITAYQCVLEAVSNQWCEAHEARDLIEIKMSNNSVLQDPFSEGVRLLNNELPVLLSWLTQVRSATDPQNSSISNQQVDFQNRVNSLENWRLRSIGGLGDQRQKLPATTTTAEDQAKQFRLLQTLLTNITPTPPSRFSQGPQIRNPILDVGTFNELPWLLAGIPLSDVPRGVNPQTGVEDVQPLSAFNSTSFLAVTSLAQYYPLNPDDIAAGINNIYTQANDLLSDERANVLNADPEILFMDAEIPQSVGNIRGISPVEAVESTLRYFHQYFWKYTKRPDLRYASTLGNDRAVDPLCPSLDIKDARSNMEAVFIQTVNVLCDVRAEIFNFVEEPQDRLNTIFNLTRLKSGTAFVEGRIQKTLRVILTNLLIDPEQQVLPLQAKLIVVEDIIEELTQYSKTNLTELKLDIENALQVSEMTLQNFAEIFADGIIKTFDQVHARWVQNPRSNQLFAKYCALLVSIPNIQARGISQVQYQRCFDTALVSQWHGETFETGFHPGLFDSSYDEERACYLRRYLRKEKFFEIYQRKNVDRELLINL